MIALDARGERILIDMVEPLSCSELEVYWRDPAPFLAEQAENRARANAAIDAGMAGLNAKQAARWAAEERNKS